MILQQHQLTSIARFNIGLNIACGLYTFFATLFRCFPVQKQWEITMERGHCLSEFSVELGVPIFGLLCDIITWVLPVPIVMKLHMNRRFRVGLLLVFAVGLALIVVGAMRLRTTFLISAKDFTGSTIVPADWGLAEPAVAIFCACAPCYAPLVSLRNDLLKFSKSCR